MTTKEKIIETAINLFNGKGYEVTTLAEVAETLGMSRGNLAYHFKEKELILEAISQQLQAEIDQEMKIRREFPAFSNLQVDIKAYHKLQLKYQFVFGNSSVLHHGCIKDVMQAWAKRTIRNNMEAFAFAVEVGNMEAEPYPGLYHHLAVNTWMIIYFWLSQKEVRDETSHQDAEKMVWATIIPHFTKKGIEAFEKYFGESSTQKLGKPFDQITQQLWEF
jgi:AcrR family transcriptional regulator